MKNAKALYQVQANDRYVPATEVTKYIRSLLAIKFPGVKFRVTKSDGSAVNVTWVLGTINASIFGAGQTGDELTGQRRQDMRTEETNRVRELIGSLHGEGFDGMTDCRFSRKHYLLPDGTIQYGGQDASGTTYTSETLPLPAGAREVHLSNSFIFCQPAY